MYATPTRLLLALVVLGLLIGCSSHLRKVEGDETGYLLALRAEYLKANPGGPHNE